MRYLRLSLCIVCGLCGINSCSVEDARAAGAKTPVAAYTTIELAHRLIDQGDITYAQLTAASLARIRSHDDAGPTLNAIVETDPNAQFRANALVGAPNSIGLLAGIPFVVKANIDTAPPLHTNAGSQAIGQRVALDHARLVAALENAGGILVGKANMSEWANFRAQKSVSGWSSVGGQTKNPHVLNRNPCGSSSGSAVAVAAGIVPLAIGTETLGSIVCPAGINGVVGLKPTLGLVSRDGLIPIASSQDTAGSFTRSVKGAAIALQVMAGPEIGDEYAQGYAGPRDYIGALQGASLQGLRVGVWRAYIGAKNYSRVVEIVDDVIATLEEGGATVVDPIGLYLERSVYEASFAVMMHEFKQGLEVYFGRAGVLNEVMAYNTAHAQKTMPWFGQDLFAAVQASALTPAEYAGALAAGKGAVEYHLDEIFEKFNLDVIIAPTNSPAWVTDYVLGDRPGVSSSVLAALSGRPAISIPAGQILSLPVGISIVGKMWRDDDLLAAAYALEQDLPSAPRPQFLPTLTH